MEFTVSKILAVAAEKANEELLGSLSAATAIASVSSSCSDISNLSAEVELTVSKILTVAAEKVNAELFGRLSDTTEGLGVNSDNTTGDDHAAPNTSEPLGASTEVIHGVPYFRDILRCETERLRRYCLTWTNVAKNTPLLSEESKFQFIDIFNLEQI